MVLNDAREFSIPLGEAADVPTDEEDAQGRRSQAHDHDGRGAMDPSACGAGAEAVDEPQVVDEPQWSRSPRWPSTRAVEEPQVVEDQPQRQVRLPESRRAEGGTGSEASSSRAPGKLETLQQQLTELRGELEGMHLDIPDALEPARSGSLNYPRTEAVRPDPQPEHNAGADAAPETQVGFG